MSTYRVVVVVVLIFALLAPITSLAQPAAAPALANTPDSPGDEYWATAIGQPGMSYDVYALTTGPDGSLYAGGEFTTAGGTMAKRVTRWDGSQWHPLGSGISGGISYSAVHALAVGSDGSLYAGGNFAEAGGVITGPIARWDGAQWHRLGHWAIQGGFVYALAFGPDGSLYVGGSFDTADELTVNSIARWDGSQWHPLGSGMDGSVLALAFGPDGSLYAGGDFNTAGGVPARKIARWNGSQWHPLSTGIERRVNALAVGTDGSLYAGGEFEMAGGLAANRLARWDGSQWHPLGSGTGGGFPQVYALAIGSDGSLYAGGAFTVAGGIAANRIARWDGSQWHTLGSGLTVSWSGGASVLALASRSDHLLYVGGTFDRAGNQPSSRIALWTGEGAPPYVPNVRAPIEQPAAGAFVSSTVTLRGFAIDLASPSSTGIDRVSVYLDGPFGTGTLIGDPTYGINRPDIAAQYGARFGPSGWELAWNTAGLAPGAHQLYLYVHRTTDNAWSVMGPHLVVVPGGPTRWLPIVLRRL